MKEGTICPYCGSEHLEWYDAVPGDTEFDEKPYYCLGCGNVFTEK